MASKSAVDHLLYLLKSDFFKDFPFSDRFQQHLFRIYLFVGLRRSKLVHPFKMFFPEVSSFKSKIVPKKNVE